MSRKEVPRPGLLKAALAGKCTNAEGAEALHLSVRQFIRVKHRFQAAGAPGLCHRLRGRPSPRRLSADVRTRVATLLQTTYLDVNDCHATEKLREVEGLRISRASVRRIRRALARPAKHRRRPRQHRARRTPAARMGALVQLDGSPGAWLEGRGPIMTLHGAIDDATNTVLALHFRPTEDLHGYATVLQQIGLAYGLPLTLYGDRFGVFVRNDPHWTLAEELQGHQHPTHFGQILRDLAVGFRAAGSPQAKGRIERLWRTLQDRLVVELRLRGLVTRAAANAYLPEFLADYNRRFTHPPADTHAAWRPRPRDFADQLSCRYTRVVAPDNTVRLGSRWVQIPPVRSAAPPRAAASTSASVSTAGSWSSVPARGWSASRRPARTSSSRRAANPTRSARGAGAPPGSRRRRGAAIPVAPRAAFADRSAPRHPDRPDRSAGRHASVAPVVHPSAPHPSRRGDIFTEQLG